MKNFTKQNERHTNGQWILYEITTMDDKQPNQHSIDISVRKF